MELPVIPSRALDAREKKTLESKEFVVNVDRGIDLKTTHLKLGAVVSASAFSDDDRKVLVQAGWLVAAPSKPEKESEKE